MLILGIETATRNCSVALVRDGVIIDHASHIGRAIHSEILLSLISQILPEKTLLNELNAIAVSIGPGSYTGLRIGLATAKGLAFPNKLSILPIPTLAVLELRARRLWRDNLILFVKSHRDLIYYCVARAEESFVLQRPVQHNHFALVCSEYPDFHFAGDSPELAADGAAEECLPDGVDVALLGYQYYEQLLPMSKPDLEPAYHSEMEIQAWQQNSK